MEAPSTTTPAPAAVLKSPRIETIDLLRGIIIVIMALDHVRDYFHAYSFYYNPADLAHTSAPIFITRWITHFCAPNFMLLAGISACLYGLKNGRKALSTFLFTRGLWLVFVELFIITLAWTFNPYFDVFILQVIWAFGISMIVLGALVYLPRPALLTIGIVLLAGHNALDSVHVTDNKSWALFWALLHDPNFSGFQFGSVNILVGYPVIPYIGIISLGYCLGSLFAPNVTPDRRKRSLRNLGLGAIGLFIVLRGINAYGDASHWTEQKNFLFTVFSFISPSKYPPSLLYALMTIGPALLFLAYAERPLGKFTRWLVVLGRVPMFFYLLHIPLIHGMGVLAAAPSGYADDMVNLTTWVTADPTLRGYGFSLPVVYIMWVVTMLVLYPLCLQFSKYKLANQGTKKWLSYF